MKAILIVILSLLISLQANAQWEIIVSTDFDGAVVQGSVDSLIKEIRNGNPVRVGWQLDFNEDKIADFDHWVEADWITVLGGHVFTQIRSIYIQGPNEEIPQVEIYPSPAEWTAVVGTNGKLLNRFVMEAPVKLEDMDEEALEKWMKRIEVKTWKVATFWSVPK